MKLNTLQFPSFATERDLRMAIVAAGVICYQQGLMPSNNGNISARMGDDQLVITPSGFCKGRMDLADLLVIDLSGNILKVHPRRKLKVSSETPMHLEVYRQRPEIRAVIHAHPAYATALTVADIPFPTDVLPEVLEGLGPVPTTRFALPSSEDNALAIREHIAQHNAILIRNHGAISYGRDLEEALNHMERLESVAKTIVLASQLGKINRLPAEMLPALEELNQKLFGKND